MHFAISSICTAFNSRAVGTRVTDTRMFLSVLSRALEVHDPSGDRTPGQHFVTLPPDAVAYVSSGVARKAGRRPEDYVVREHREHCGAYIQRRYAEPATSVAVVVYIREAYLTDPDISPEEIAAMDPSTTHVVVAVLASAGPQAPHTPTRFIHNLAGGNKDADTYDLDTIRQMARDIKAYYDIWGVVAD